jgi:hypothetical protein
MQRCDSRNDEIITEKRVKKAAVAQVCDLYKDTDGGKEKFRALKRKTTGSLTGESARLPVEFTRWSGLRQNH